MSVDTRHPSRPMLDLFGDVVDIDEAMVPIITSLWRRGVHTCHCCQDYEDGEGAMLGLASIFDADRLYLLACAGGGHPGFLSRLRWDLRPYRGSIRDAHVNVRVPTRWLDWLTRCVDHDRPVPDSYAAYLEWALTADIPTLDPPTLDDGRMIQG